VRLPRRRTTGRRAGSRRWHMGAMVPRGRSVSTGPCSSWCTKPGKRRVGYSSRHAPRTEPVCFDACHAEASRRVCSDRSRSQQPSRAARSNVCSSTSVLFSSIAPFRLCLLFAPAAVVVFCRGGGVFRLPPPRREHNRAGAARRPHRSTQGFSPSSAVGQSVPACGATGRDKTAVAVRRRRSYSRRRR